MQRAFPAKFTDSILAAGARVLADYGLANGTVLDIFGGVGGIHKLADHLPEIRTVAVEIEAEFAAEHPRTVHGDSNTLGDPNSTAARGVCDVLGVPTGHHIDAVFTSSSYGNRFSDGYLGSDNEKCRPCDGTGGVAAQPHDLDGDAAACPKCEGTGRSRSKRFSYAVAKGSPLVDDNAAKYHFWRAGGEYQTMHTSIFHNTLDFVGPGTLLLFNISSVIRKKTGYVPVMEWWVDLIATRASIERLIAIPTPRVGFGANRDVRVPAEHLIVATYNG